MIYVLSGSGGSKATGVCGIKASWPEGVSCTVSSGTKKISAGKDTTKWIFMLPFAGEWTVTAGELAKTVTVAEGEIKEVKLREAILLYEIGDQATDLTGGWSKTGYSYNVETDYGTYAPTFDDAGMHFKTNAAGTYSTISGTKNAIDLTLVETITVNVSEFNSVSGGQFYLVCNTAKTVWTSGMKKAYRIQTSGEHVIDVSSLNGVFYVALVLFGTSNGAMTATVESISMKEKEITWFYNKGDKGVNDFLLTTQKQSSSYTGVAPTFTDNGDSFTASLKYGSSYTSGGVIFPDMIDLTNYTTLYFEVTAIANKPNLWVGTSTTTNFNSCTSAGKTLTATGTPYINVSSLSGQYYVGIRFAVSTSGATSSITVRRIGAI